MPGPQVPVYMNGAKQVATYGLAPLVDGMGLFVATPSYDGKISFNVTSTRETLPDIEFFVDCIDEALAACSKTVAKPKSRRARRK